MTWQPIESAPKDEKVLLGHWRDWPVREWECRADLAVCTKGGWRDGHATHWHPLPDPPVQP